MEKCIFIAIFAMFFFMGCGKTEGCKQPFSQDEIPELQLEGYNTCEAIYKNYTYLVCDGLLESHPYWEHEGDTIKVCGYLYERWGEDRSLLPLVDYSNDNEFCIYVVLDNESEGCLPNNIDKSKKIYVTGQLHFYPLRTEGTHFYVVPGLTKVINVCFE